jgi:hypothetical protein
MEASKHILIAVDDSDASDRAVSYVLKELFQTHVADKLMQRAQHLAVWIVL